MYPIGRLGKWGFAISLLRSALRLSSLFLSRLCRSCCREQPRIPGDYCVCQAPCEDVPTTVSFIETYRASGLFRCLLWLSHLGSPLFLALVLRPHFRPARKAADKSPSLRSCARKPGVLPAERDRSTAAVVCAGSRMPTMLSPERSRPAEARASAGAHFRLRCSPPANGSAGRLSHDRLRSGEFVRSGPT
jgi:hypothetical protein